MPKLLLSFKDKQSYYRDLVDILSFLNKEDSTLFSKINSAQAVLKSPEETILLKEKLNKKINDLITEDRYLPISDNKLMKKPFPVLGMILYLNPNMYIDDREILTLHDLYSFFDNAINLNENVLLSTK